jgi:nucleotide-binding universal stress UspA family protein
MIAKILAALDLSRRTPQVFDTAAEIASSFRATVIPFHAFFVPAELAPAAAGIPEDALPNHVREAREQELRRFSTRLPNVIVAEPIVRRASQPWRAIVDVSDELDVDLIVIGSHGYHGLDRVLGTTAGKVANHAHRNVIVVHDRTAASAFTVRAVGGTT